jgi:hypothetical protein
VGFANEPTPVEVRVRRCEAVILFFFLQFSIAYQNVNFQKEAKVKRFAGDKR